jgi:hypothetical protein
MHVLTFFIWVASLVVLAIAAFFPNRYNFVAVGLFLMDLWLGLQVLMEVTDPITF